MSLDEEYRKFGEEVGGCDPGFIGEWVDIHLADPSPYREGIIAGGLRKLNELPKMG